MATHLQTNFERLTAKILSQLIRDVSSRVILVEQTAEVILVEQTAEACHHFVLLGRTQLGEFITDVVYERVHT
uniref:Uncharacterized protein n=1 Tax=Pristionchus pacificus TaxID=54126 RepID=A0A2A6B978_PRIPA|eukprot:PDM62421.1 hypothetical protein PRIPAC_51863 [Pristionchus pacificus]